MVVVVVVDDDLRDRSFLVVWAGSFWVSSGLVVNPSPFWVVPRRDKACLYHQNHTTM